MKKSGSVFEYTADRDNDLMNAYHKLISEARHLSLPDIYRRVVDMPSKRFWVSEERAAIVLSLMVRDEKHINRFSKSKKEMYEELYRRAMKLKKERPEMSISEIAFQVVQQTAPKFYLTPGSAKIIICRAKKKWYEERKRRMRHLY